MNALVLNCGSSSLKFRVVDIRDELLTIMLSGMIERIGGVATLTLADERVREGPCERQILDHRQAVQWVFERLGGMRIDAVGHRVVHGGEEFREPVLIDEAVMAAIERLAELAPLHNPGCLAGITGARAAMGTQTPMVAVFDTAFHRTIPPYAAMYAIDLDLARKYRIQRFGFHGIAHASLAAIAAAALHRPLAELRLITVQLGNGCSATAIDRGRSVDTSMGFTPLEGLVMGTRSGDVDPALVAYLGRKEGLSADQVERLLNERSGLLGLSGLSPDMRDILKAVEGKPDSRAALAVEVFCHRVRKYIGAYLAVLGGADAIVFGGGIGERSAAIRARVCAGMGWCGLQLDARRNDAAAGVAAGDAVRISDDQASLACYVAGVDEEIAIARATRDCVMSLSA